MFDAASASTAFDGLLANVSTVLGNNYATVLAIVGALIGLGVVIRFVKRHIGRKA